MKKAALIICTLLLFTGCNKTKDIGLEDIQEGQIIELEEEIVEPEIEEDLEEEVEEPEIEEEYTINEAGMTVQDRYPAPQGYVKAEVPANSFGEFLRNQELKPYGEKVLFYDETEKASQGIYDSAFVVDIGNRDLHQCADAIMLLRAEYLYQKESYDEISFHFVSGFNAEYKKWKEGYRINVDEGGVSYYPATEPSTDYESFRKYMDMVMAYAGTPSLEKELNSVAIDDMEVGDVFIIGGSPGHAVVVVDMAINPGGEKMFLLAQSYMPAQQTQILVNPMDNVLSPWYSLKGKEELITPEWDFELSHLKRF